MRYKFTDSQIPEKVKTKEFRRNAWIAPNGDFYGFSGAEHHRFAAWIAVFEEGGDENTLEKGKFFKEIWDDWLLVKGYLAIKDASWMGCKSTALFFNKNLTQKQLNTLFDYCECFNINYNKLINGQLL